MRARGKALRVVVIMLSFLAAVSVEAGTTSVDCSRKSLATELGKLDKTLINVINVTGNCVGDIVISDHANLTLVGTNGARITAGNPGGIAVNVASSRVTIRGLLVNAGAGGSGILCENRAVCVLQDVGVVGAVTGISAQNQSAVDIIGASYVQGSSAPFGIGVGVFGASSVNIRPAWLSGFDPLEAGPSISQNVTGITVQDGSYLRTDNTLITGNTDGVFAHRNATIKVLGGPGGVVNNTGTGVAVIYGAVAQIASPVTGNALAGVSAGPLSYVRIQGGAGSVSGNGLDIECWHASAYVHGGGYSCL